MSWYEVAQSKEYVFFILCLLYSSELVTHRLLETSLSLQSPASDTLPTRPTAKLIGSRSLWFEKWDSERTNLRTQRFQSHAITVLNTIPLYAASHITLRRSGDKPITRVLPEMIPLSDFHKWIFRFHFTYTVPAAAPVQKRFVSNALHLEYWVGKLTGGCTRNR